jgi:hypothetical protein
VVQVDDVFADRIVVERLGKFGPLAVAKGGVAEGCSMGGNGAGECGCTSNGACKVLVHRDGSHVKLK